MSDAPPVGLDLPGLQLVVDAGDVTRVAAFLDLPGATGEGQLVRLRSEWRGNFHLVLGSIAVDGLAIVGTDPPDLLVLLSAEFVPSLQLSFGFTLVNVGGIVGINRRPDAQRLSELVESGELARLLFPRDPANEAERLLPLLHSCFERRPGSFVIGPLLRVGWGTPTIISATVGVLISDDAVTIIGRLVAELPFEKAGLIHLEALVLGRVDSDGVAIDAALVNSHIVGVPIGGDVRLRIKTSGAGLFAFSAGGFHPAFPVPAGMGGMRRISTSISPGPLLEARLEAYLAITTNSAQFGARVDVKASIPGFGIRGYAAFDALFLFDPFRFETSFDAMVSIEVGGVDVVGVSLHARLSGPAPWRIRGHASITILLLDVDVDIPELVWGPNTSEPLPKARDPVAVLAHELERPENWSATSQGLPALARLRPTIQPGVAVVHPMAVLGFRQHAVPIGVELRRMDGVPLSEPTKLTVHVDDNAKEATGLESFMRQQFDTLDDNARLAGSGFQLWPGGFDVHSTENTVGAVVPKSEGYELRVLDKDGQIKRSRDAVSGTAVAGHRASATLLPSKPMVLLKRRQPVASR